MPLTKEKQIVIKAINDLGRYVSAADVATKTGLPVAKATQNLNQIAQETSGHLQVSTQGDIAYKFPLTYQTAYVSKGIKRFVDEFTKKFFAIGFFLLRISFGIMLILSLVTIVLLFVLIITVASRGDNKDSPIIDIDFFDWMILRDLIYWNTYYPDSTGNYNNRTTKKKTNKTNFLYNCFSFLFGDGNPNENLEERRWYAIAQLIRQKKGAVTVEELAPFLDNGLNNEDSMLPVLVRFDGRPVVTDSGNIIYLFPALQVTTMREQIEKLPSYLKTFPWQFSQIDIGSLSWVMILAAINFFAAWCLYIEAANFLPSLLPILLVLVIYGTLFVAIPIIRYIAIQFLNKNIEKGNMRREEYALHVTNPNKELAKKLSESQGMLLESRPIKADSLIYDTQKDILEQEFPTISNS